MSARYLAVSLKQREMQMDDRTTWADLSPAEQTEESKREAGGPYAAGGYYETRCKWCGGSQHARGADCPALDHECSPADGGSEHG